MNRNRKNMHTFILARIIALAFGSLLLASSSHSSDLPLPQGQIILTVEGKVGVTNEDGKAVFDLEMLRSLPKQQFNTSTIWTEGIHSFTGVNLADLIEVVGGSGRALKLTALNDYAIEIPLSDATQNGPIVAYEMDASTISVREKGPLWIMYPFDLNIEFQNELIYSRSIWQLMRIELIE